MAEFIEVPIEREDGSEGLHYVNIEAISYVDSHVGQEGEGRTLTVYLDNGYWFTLLGTKMNGLLEILKTRVNRQINNDICDQIKLGEPSVGSRQQGGAMRSTVETIAAAVERKAHSFDHIRRTTGLTLTDEQFVAMIEKNRDRFKLVHFVKRDDEGEPILPGRPGVRLRADSA